MEIRPKVLLTDPMHPEPAARIAARADLVLAPGRSPQDLIAAARDAAVIIVRTPIPPELFAQAPLLRGAIRHGAGIDMIPIDAASELGVAVANVPGANAVSVAEYAMGQMLNLAHRLGRIDKTLHSTDWPSARKLADDKIEITGRTLGIVGTGQIGRALGAMAHHGFRMKVLGYRPSGLATDPHIEMVDLPSLFEHADFIVVACPLNDSTRGLVNADLLARMKPTAFIVNVSRGAVIEENALIHALQNRRIAGAALDVFQTQPLPEDSPLRRLDQVLLSSHIAGITDDSLRRMGDGVATQVMQLLDGRLPEHLCNRDHSAAIEQRLQRLAASE